MGYYARLWRDGWGRSLNPKWYRGRDGMWGHLEWGRGCGCGSGSGCGCSYERRRVLLR